MSETNNKGYQQAEAYAKGTRSEAPDETHHDHARGINAWVLENVGSMLSEAASSPATSDPVSSAGLYEDIAENNWVSVLDDDLKSLVGSFAYMGRGIVLAGGGSGTNRGDVFRSTDSGKTWSAVEIDTALESITSLCNLGNGVALVGVGTSAGDGDIYKTTDYGVNWSKVREDATYDTVDSLEYLGNGVVLAGFGKDAGEADIVRSTDFGDTWESVIERRANAERVRGFAYCGDGVVITTSQTSNDLILADRSTDYGATWTNLDISPAGDFTTEGGRSVEYIGNGVVLLGVLYQTGTRGSNPLLYRSTDKGQTWTAITGFDSSVRGAMSIEHLGGNVVLMGTATTDTTADLLKSTDGGLTWSTVQSFSNTASINAIEYLGDGVTLVGNASSSGPTDDDIWRSTLANDDADGYFEATSAVVWGGITGTLSNQTDLQTALDAKVEVWGDITGTLSNQTDLQSALDAKGEAPSVNYEVLSATKTLTESDAKVQILDPTTSLRIVNLPTTPSADIEFLIVCDGNTGGAAEYLEVRVDGDSAEFQWLSQGASMRFVYQQSIDQWIGIGQGFRIVRTGVNAFTFDNSVTIGYEATNYRNNGTVIGGGAAIYTSNLGTAIGFQARNVDLTSAGTALGDTANASTQAVAVGVDTDATGAFTVAIGRLAQATATDAVAIGAETDATGTQSLAIGDLAQALATNAVAIGHDAETSIENSTALGVDSIGLRQFGTAFSRNTANSARTEQITSGVQTTDATQTTLTPDLDVSASSAVMFRIQVVAREDATNDSKVWTIEGGIKRDGSNNTALIGTITKTVIGADAGASAWDVTAEADDTNEKLDIKVTGEASHTIEWGATTLFTEVI